MNAIRKLARLIAPLLIFAHLGCDDETMSIEETRTIFGTGEVVEEPRDVGGFTGVSQEIVADLHIVLGAEESLRVSAQANLLPHIVTEVQNGVLRIRSEANVDLEPTLPIELDLTATTLESIALVGVGDIDAPEIVGSSLALSLSGLGNIELASVVVGSLDVVIPGIGDVVLSGEGNEQAITISGKGAYEALNLSSAETEALISGLGSMSVRVSDRLIATITGTGTICYSGDPTVESTITGLGSVGPCRGRR
jgi:hypothetical protein